MNTCVRRAAMRAMISGAFVSSMAAMSVAGDIAFNIVATNQNGTGTYQSFWDGEPGSWSLDEPIQLRDATTNLWIATLETASVDVGAGSPELGPPNPNQINLNFAVQAGATDTTFTIDSTQLFFGPFSNAQGRATAAFTVTDLNSNGAMLTGQGPNSGSYMAQYNGFVPTGSTFAEGINSIIAPSGSNFGTLNMPAGPGFVGIAGSVGDMSSRVHFTLSARDFASGTSNYEIIPEPATLGLLLMGFGLIRRR